MKVLIVGGSGYVGARLEAYLKKKNHEVIATSRKTMGDVTDEDFFTRLAPKNFDAVIYTVSLNHHDCGKVVAKTVDVNIKATWRALETFQKANAKKFIYFSTQQVYGPFSANTDYSENANPQPKNAYGLTHLMSENLCNYYFQTSNLKSVSVRLSNAVGRPIVESPHISSLVIPDFCRQAAKNQEIKLQSDGTPQRNFITLGDLSRAVEALLHANSLKYSVFNLGSSQTLTLGEAALRVAKTYEKLFSKKVNVFRNDGKEISEDNYQNVNRFVYPSSRLAELGFQAHETIDSGIEEILKAN